MKVSVRLLPALLLASAAASAVNVPIPVEGATLNVNVQLQPWFQVLEDYPSPNVGEQFFMRRARMLLQGNFSKEVLYLIQIDSPNFGKAGDFTIKTLLQDAWIAWNPTEGVFLDFGLLLLPFARHILQSTTSYTNLDFHVDSITGGNRIPNNDGFRDVGASLRGWLFDKRIGYRFGAYTGNRSTTPTSLTNTTPANPAINHQGTPRFAGFLNFNIIGSEEGAWLYQGLYFDKTVVSVGAGFDYQSGGTVAPYGVTDHKTVSADIFMDFALDGDQEIIISGTGYRFDNGSGSGDTGWGGFVDLGYRIGKWQPFVSGEAFSGDGCDTNADGTIRLPCSANKRDLRIGAIGLNYWIKRNLLHINSEYAIIRGTTQTNAGALAGTLTSSHQQRFTLAATLFF
jgi:hypothetical protein